MCAPKSVARANINHLGDGRFVFVNNALSTNSESSFSAAWGDFNRDGVLDVYLANYVANQTVESRFYLRRPDGSFERLTGGGNAAEPGKRFSATVASATNVPAKQFLTIIEPGGPPRLKAYENQTSLISFTL